MSRVLRSALYLVVVAAVAYGVPKAAWGVAANPLQSAYWRFEEGAAGTPVDAPGHDRVVDTINENHLDVFSTTSAPSYLASAAPTALKSGAANSLALNFAGDDDLYTLFTDDAPSGAKGKKINNGILAAGQGFTLEAAFQPASLGSFQAIVAKEGTPVENNQLPTLALKIRGDNNSLQIEQFDGAKNLVSVSSLAAMNIGSWYYAAVVNDGSKLKLYLDGNDGNGYQLQGETDVIGALFQGDNVAAPDWSNSWTVGRGQYADNPADSFNGVIDEVRLYNRALDPSEFLFAPPAVNPGDYNGDGTVDAADYVLWRDGGHLQNDNTTGNQPGDYDVWRANFGNTNLVLTASTAGAVPEPATSLMIAAAVVALLGWCRVTSRFPSPAR